MTTDADEALDATRVSVEEAISALAAIVVRECHGSDHYSQKFRREMRDALNQLMDVRDTLK